MTDKILDNEKYDVGLLAEKINEIIDEIEKISKKLPPDKIVYYDVNNMGNQ